MKILSFLLLVLVMSSCATAKHPKEIVQEQPKFANSRSFEEEPKFVKAAAQKVLEDMIQASDPPTNAAVKIEGDTLRSGWVYGVSKDKYVSYDFNGAPRRKALKVRRNFIFTVTPSLAGSNVVVSADEELEKIDLKSGESKGWRSAAVDNSVYDEMLRRLKEKIRSL